MGASFEGAAPPWRSDASNAVPGDPVGIPGGRPRVAIIGAMDEEVSAFLAHAETQRVAERGTFRIHEATLFGVPVVVVKCGVGKVFAAMIAQHLVDACAPSAVISTGVAGGLSPDLAIGDVVVSRDCVHHDMDVRALGFARGHIPFTDLRFFASDPALGARALGARLASGHRVVRGRIVTGDQFISGARHETHAHLTDELNGDAVDMESAAIAQVCHAHGVPFVSIRTISDKADGSAHADFNAFLPEVARNSFEVVKSLLEAPQA
jgi:adenosylhomocysteine nucleosidase